MKTKITLTLALLTLSACGGGGSQSPASSSPTPVTKEEGSIEKVERRELKMKNGNLVLTEYAYCVRASGSAGCNNEALLQLTNGGQETWFAATLPFVSRPTVTRLTADDGRARMQRLPATTARSIEAALDFAAIENVLDLDHFFALYRCRSTSQSRRLIEAGPSLQGNYVVQHDGYFSVSRESGILPTFEYDRRTGNFVGFSLYVVPAKHRLIEPTHPTLELVLSAVHGAEDFVAGNLVNAPAQVRTFPFRNTCDRLYETYRYSTIFKDPHDPAEKFLPLLDDDLENDPAFRNETEIRTDEEGPLLESAWLAAELNEAFFDGRRYPRYPYKSDSLWFEVQKLKQEKLK